MNALCVGDSTSRASVHVDHGVITASITTKDDIYIIEVINNLNNLNVHKSFNSGFM